MYVFRRSNLLPIMGQMDKLFIIQKNQLAAHFALSERRQCFFLCR